MYDSPCLVWPFAGQQATGQRQAHDDAGAGARGFWQQLGRDFLAEYIKDHLQRQQAVLFHRQQAFFDGFHAGPKVGNQTFGLKIAQPVEDVTFGKFIARDAMQGVCELW